MATSFQYFRAMKHGLLLVWMGLLVGLTGAYAQGIGFIPDEPIDVPKAAEAWLKKNYPEHYNVRWTQPDTKRLKLTLQLVPNNTAIQQHDVVAWFDSLGAWQQTWLFVEEGSGQRMEQALKRTDLEALRKAVRSKHGADPEAYGRFRCESCFTDKKTQAPISQGYVLRYGFEWWFFDNKFQVLEVKEGL